MGCRDGGGPIFFLSPWVSMASPDASARMVRVRVPAPVADGGRRLWETSLYASERERRGKRLFNPLLGAGRTPDSTPWVTERLNLWTQVYGVRVRVRESTRVTAFTGGSRPVFQHDVLWVRAWRDGLTFSCPLMACARFPVFHRGSWFAGNEARTCAVTRVKTVKDTRLSDTKRPTDRPTECQF